MKPAWNFFKIDLEALFRKASHGWHSVSMGESSTSKSLNHTIGAFSAVGGTWENSPSLQWSICSTIVNYDSSVVLTIAIFSLVGTTLESQLTIVVCLSDWPQRCTSPPHAAARYAPAYCYQWALIGTTYSYFLCTQQSVAVNLANPLLPIVIVR